MSDIERKPERLEPDIDDMATYLLSPQEANEAAKKGLELAIEQLKARAKEAKEKLDSLVKLRETVDLDIVDVVFDVKHYPATIANLEMQLSELNAQGTGEHNDEPF